MKKIFAIFFVTMLVFLSPVSVMADGNAPLLVDDADLLTETEETELLQKLNTLSQKVKADIAVVTVTSDEIGFDDITTYTENFYDNNGYGQGEKNDGVMFLIYPEERAWHITTTGNTVKDLREKKQNKITAKMIPYLQSDDFAGAFAIFADMSAKYIKNSNSVTAGWIIGDLIVSLVLALSVAFYYKSKLKSVHFQEGADNYLDEGSVNMTVSNDMFVREFTTTRHIDRDSGSSSGSSHGGTSGSY